jgi:hypothetical protein
MRVRSSFFPQCTNRLVFVLAVSNNPNLRRAQVKN